MDLDLACTVCHWGRDFWEWIAIGAAGAAVAAGAASDFFSNTGEPTYFSWDQYGRDHADAPDDERPDEDGGDVTPPDPRDFGDRYGDRDGRPYWPGVSPYPRDGVVYRHGRALEVDAAGVPIDPDPGPADSYYTHVSAARG